MKFHSSSVVLSLLVSMALLQSTFADPNVQQPTGPQEPAVPAITHQSKQPMQRRAIPPPAPPKSTPPNQPAPPAPPAGNPADKQPTQRRAIPPPAPPKRTPPKQPVPPATHANPAGNPADN
ncbi:hypothetical protein EDD21DRAFT_417254 [Dissophora ornata]|nr:hypothetical protein EDD21DRAFT_417254 [Dissophora ornata]